MRNAFAVSFTITVASALGRTTTVAGGPLGNGDVNADGVINISDPVYLLTHLFLAGPAPVAIECMPRVGEGLPDTGQSKCYVLVEDEDWAEVPCDQAACKGQDGSYATGCPSEGRFLDNGDGTVRDNCTGLMWQKETADVNGNGKVFPEDTSDRVSWCDALAYCENLDFAGHDDWRLPNVRELQSIMDYGRFSPPIDPVFGAVEETGYWSSTTYVTGLVSNIAWFVGFGPATGLVGDSAGSRDWALSVRAVRGGH